jgi:hypothetical protein
MTSIIVFLPLLSHPVFAAAMAAKMNLNLILDTKTLKFQDINNNKKPDPGEMGTVLGALFPGAGNNTQIGTQMYFPLGRMG